MAAATEALADRPPPWTDRAPARLRYYLPTLLVALLVLVAWELAVRVFNIRQFLLPRPTSIVLALVDQWPILISKGLSTLRSAVGGFVLGSVAGVGVALVTAR